MLYSRFLLVICLMYGSVYVLIPTSNFILAYTWLFICFGHATCGILVPWPGIEPYPLHWKHSLNHWTTREVSAFSFVDYYYRIWDFLASVHLGNYSHYFFLMCNLSQLWENFVLGVFQPVFLYNFMFWKLSFSLQNEVSHAHSDPFLSESGNQPFL